MKKQLFFMFNILLAFTLLLSACSSSGANSESSGDSDTIIFKATHVTQETHIWHKTAEKFGEELEALSGGKMKLEIYPAAQLGQEKDMVQQLETGSLDFGFLTNAYMSTRQESLNAWFMPFAFNNLAEAVEMKDSEAAKEMLAELESQGLVGLDYVFAGNRHVLMKENHVSSPEDLKGKKIRIIGSPAIQDFWAETGAGPTAMPLSEIYTSLQTGVIDGIDIDLDALVTEKYYENANNLTLTNHMTFPAVIVMSQQSYANLSEENQQIVKEALSKAVEWGNAEAIKREEENLQTLKDAGVEVQELSNPDSFDEIKAKVIDQYSQKSPAIQSFIDSAK